MARDYTRYSLRPLEASCVLVAALLSTLACIWLLRRLNRLVENVRGYLFPRQLWHLAFANLMMHSSVVILSVMDLVHDALRAKQPISSSGVQTYSCILLDPAFRYGRCVSVLVQFVIGAGFAAQGHLKRTMLLARFAKFVWMIGAACAALDTAEAYYLDDTANDFGLCPLRPHATWTSVVLMVLVYIPIIGWTLVVAIPRAYFGEHAKKSPKLVENLRRAVAFSLCFPVAYLPMMIGFAPLQLDPELTEKLTWYFSFEYTTEALAGILNCGTYALQSQYARILFRTNTLSIPHQNSAHIHLPGRVGFAGVDVIEVLPLAEAAKLQAERELAIMEDKGLNGLWISTQTQERLNIRGTTIRWEADDSTSELEVHGRDIKLIFREQIYWGELVDGGGLLQWSDGDSWRRTERHMNRLGSLGSL